MDALCYLKQSSCITDFLLGEQGLKIDEYGEVQLTGR